jgi:radical SAM superfamily enzyme YgiQ (UPF0313 family)
MDEKMKIALVWPKGFDTTYTMPLSLGYLKSNADSEKYHIRIFDCALMDLDSSSPKFSRQLVDFGPHVVGVSCWSPTFNEALKVLRVAKKIDSHTITVIGGPHATCYAGRVMEHKEIDFLFRGEAEKSFQLFLDKLRRNEMDLSAVKGLMYRLSDGSIVKNEIVFEERLDDIKIPDYDEMNLDKYLESGYRWNTPVKRNAPIFATRGCPYQCKFCSASILSGRKVRKHSIEYMIEWIKFLYYEKNTRWFNIIDDNFTFDTGYAAAFCEHIIELGLKDIGFGTPNGVRMQRGSPELWRLMKRAGWKSVNVAPESGSKRVLRLMKKDLDIDVVPEVVAEMRAVGLKVQAYFILGYPGETEEDLHETEQLLKKCRFNFVFFNNFQPLPGTQVYDELVEKKEIPDGLLPENFSDGSRAYTPPELRGFNFSRFIIRSYFSLIMREPLNIFYILKMFPLRMYVRKLLLNIKSMVLHKFKGNY